MALGRGLGELLGEVESAYENSTRSNKSGVFKIEVTAIKANPNQPRKIKKKKKLNDLSESIKEHGLLQPIIVIENDNYDKRLIKKKKEVLICKYPIEIIDKIN